MDIALELQNLETRSSSFLQDLSRLEGKKALLSQQIEDNKAKTIVLEELKILSVKATEVLHLVQKATRDKVVEAFESTVTYALRSIYQDDGYSFKLEFGQRGNIGELSFKMKSPTTQGYLDLKDCSSGGQLDVVAIALRFMLLHLVQPKCEGPVLLDESSKMLSANYRENEFNLYKMLSNKFNRQILVVTHSQELADLADHKIQIGV